MTNNDVVIPVSLVVSLNEVTPTNCPPSSASYSPVKFGDISSISTARLVFASILSVILLELNVISLDNENSPVSIIFSLAKSNWYVVLRLTNSFTTTILDCALPSPKLTPIPTSLFTTKVPNFSNPEI